MAIPLFHPQAASADVQSDVQGGTYIFDDRAAITATYGSTTGPVDFVDQNAAGLKGGDTDNNYAPTDAPATLCDPHLGSVQYGITFGSNFLDEIKAVQNAVIPGTLDIGYLNVNKCVAFGSNDGGTTLCTADDKGCQDIGKIPISVGNPNGVAIAELQWDILNITTLPEQQPAETFTPTGDPLVYVNSTTGCGGHDVIILGSAGGNSGDAFYMVPSSVGSLEGGVVPVKTYASEHNYPQLASDFPSDCEVVNSYGIDNTGDYPVTIAGTYNQSPTVGAAGSTSATPTCEDSDFDLSWLFCKVIEGAAQGLDYLYGSLIQPLLSTNPINLSNPSSDPTKTYAIWDNFRIYGDIFLVIALLVVVFGESIGGGAIDAYTAKKVLPRLLAAAILINLSIYLVAFVMDMTNVVGHGLEALIQAPFNNAGGFVLSTTSASSKLGGGLGFIGLVGLTGAGAIWATSFTGAFLEFLLLGILLPALLFFLAIFVVLLLRRGLILFLLFISPVAFALYCLPNTEKYFRQWWSLLIKTMLMFPIISMLFALGNILSVTINSTTTGLGSGLAELVSLVALIAPLFLIPFSFKLAGGVMGQAADFINNGKNRFAQPIGKLRAQRMQKNRQEMAKRAKGEDFFRKAEAGSWQDRFNQRLARASNVGVIGSSGLSRRAIKRDITASITANKNKLRKEDAENSAAYQVFSGDETMLQAAQRMVDGGEGEATAFLKANHIEGESLERDIGLLRQAQLQMGGKNLALTASVAIAATGPGYANGPGDGYDAIMRYSGGDLSLAIPALADLRDNFERGRRNFSVESFPNAMRHMIEINSQTDPQAREAAIMMANEQAADNALDTKGVGILGNTRGSEVENIGSKAIERRLKRTMQAVTDTSGGGAFDRTRFNPDTGEKETITIDSEVAKRQYVQAMAQTSTMIDYSGSFSPEIQRTLAGVHDQEVDITQLSDDLRSDLARTVSPDGGVSSTILPSRMTNGQLYQLMEKLPYFQEVKKVYGSQFEAERRPGGPLGGEAGPPVPPVPPR